MAPLVVAPFHSQMPEAMFGHHPGLIVVSPATVADAYGMLRQALRQDDPVIFCEHKFLYERLRDEQFDSQRPVADLGRAVVRRRNLDCTVVAWSAMVHEALAAAEQLASDGGPDIEVVDLRCVRPFDLGTVLESVQRTGHLVVVSEAFPTAGVAAEVVAKVSEHGFSFLDAPPRRVTAKDTPIPFHPQLWSAHRPEVPSSRRSRRHEVLMREAIKLPPFGEGVASAEITAWLVDVGDTVERGEDLLEVQTTKASLTVAAPNDGVLAEALAAIGDELEVGAVLGWLTVDGDEDQADADAAVPADLPHGAAIDGGDGSQGAVVAVSEPTGNDIASPDQGGPDAV